MGAGLTVTAWLEHRHRSLPSSSQRPSSCTCGGPSNGEIALTRRAVAWASLAWALAGILGATAGFLSESTGAAGFDVLGPAVLLAAGAAGPVGMAVGVTRPEVVDVRGVVTGVVVVATVLVLYVARRRSVSWRWPRSPSALRRNPSRVILVAGVLAFGVRPVQILLRGVVDRLLFGDRPDPLTAASRIADGVGEDPGVALRTVCQALALPYASLTVDGQTLATSGTRVTHVRSLPLHLEPGSTGEIAVGLRAGDLRLTRDDQEVLPHRGAAVGADHPGTDTGPRPRRVAGRLRSPPWRRSDAGCAATFTTALGRH